MGNLSPTYRVQVGPSSDKKKKTCWRWGRVYRNSIECVGHMSITQEGRNTYTSAPVKNTSYLIFRYTQHHLNFCALKDQTL
jgi:hypothetical protein